VLFWSFLLPNKLKANKKKINKILNWKNSAFNKIQSRFCQTSLAIPNISQILKKFKSSNEKLAVIRKEWQLFSCHSHLISKWSLHIKNYFFSFFLPPRSFLVSTFSSVFSLLATAAEASLAWLLFFLLPLPGIFSLLQWS